VVTKTPCVAIKSADHKIKEFMHFLKGSNAVVFIDKNLEELPKTIEKMLGVVEPLYPDLTRYYEELAEIIKLEMENENVLC
jgi:prefoldin subunit 5